MLIFKDSFGISCGFVELSVPYSWNGGAGAMEGSITSISDIIQVNQLFVDKYYYVQVTVTRDLLTAIESKPNRDLLVTLQFPLKKALSKENVLCVWIDPLAISDAT